MGADRCGWVRMGAGRCGWVRVGAGRGGPPEPRAGAFFAVSPAHTSSHLIAPDRTYSHLPRHPHLPAPTRTLPAPIRTMPDTLFVNGILWTGLGEIATATRRWRWPAIHRRGRERRRHRQPAAVRHPRRGPRRADAAAGLRGCARPHLEDRPPADDAARPAGRGELADLAARPREGGDAALATGSTGVATAGPLSRGPRSGRHDLDAVVADRPIVLMRTCAHHRLNSRALEAAGDHARHRAAAPAAPSSATPPASPTGCSRSGRWGWCCNACRHRRPPTTRR